MFITSMFMFVMNTPQREELVLQAASQAELQCTGEYRRKFGFRRLRSVNRVQGGP